MVNPVRYNLDDQTVTTEPMGLERNQLDFWNLHARIRLETKFDHCIRKSIKSI